MVKRDRAGVGGETRFFQIYRIVGRCGGDRVQDVVDKVRCPPPGYAGPVRLGAGGPRVNLLEPLAGASGIGGACFSVGRGPN